MNIAIRVGFALLILASGGVVVQDGSAQERERGFHPAIPKTWDDAAIAALEVPLADPSGSPKHVSADYYYQIPVRPIYRQYDWYAPGREPAGYIEQLKKRDPEVLWGEDKEGRQHAPPLNTETDWIKAGELVFRAPTSFGGTLPMPGSPQEAGLREAFDAVRPPLTKDGLMPFDHLVIREKGKIEIGAFSCAECHTRVMLEGTIIEGAQGNFPFDRRHAFLRSRQPLETARTNARCALLRGSIRIPRRGSRRCPWRRSRLFIERFRRAWWPATVPALSIRSTCRT
jgi:hypothetical protein